MKLRALLLIAIIIGGTYVMIQSNNEYKIKEFGELINNIDEPFVSLLFKKPPTDGSNIETWIINDESEIDSLVLFLQKYNVRKIEPEELKINNEQFSISLVDESSNEIRIIVNENLIIQNSTQYFEIINGPLDVDWIIHFFISNYLPKR